MAYQRRISTPERPLCPIDLLPPIPGKNAFTFAKMERENQAWGDRLAHREYIGREIQKLKENEYYQKSPMMRFHIEKMAQAPDWSLDYAREQLGDDAFAASAHIEYLLAELDLGMVYVQCDKDGNQISEEVMFAYEVRDMPPTQMWRPSEWAVLSNTLNVDEVHIDCEKRLKTAMERSAAIKEQKKEMRRDLAFELPGMVSDQRMSQPRVLTVMPAKEAIGLECDECDADRRGGETVTSMFEDRDDGFTEYWKQGFGQEE
jgi:hypothetical protein